MTTNDRIYVAVCTYSAVLVARAPGVLFPAILWAASVGAFLVAHWLSDRRKRRDLIRKWRHAQANQKPPTIL